MAGAERKKGRDVNREITQELRKRAAALLASGDIAAFVGFRIGSHPMIMRPFVARSPEEAERLVWNSFCVINLANYLPGLLRSLEPPRRPGDPPPEGPLPKVGVVATGCWSRNMVVQIQENQIQRQRVVIIGIPSRGMIDRRKVELAAEGAEITGVQEGQHKLKVSTSRGEIELNRWDLVRDNCLTCQRPDPVIYDEMIGQPQWERKVSEPFRQVEEIEALDPDERWAWFTQEISSCIRCYACRNACPLCYCPTCFVDDSRPQWVGKSREPVDTALFHILRAYHCAGRCTDCGTCESVCPMGIKMRLLTRKLQKDVKELYGFEPGLSLEEPLPLSTYRPDDPEPYFDIRPVDESPKPVSGGGGAGEGDMGRQKG